MHLPGHQQGPDQKPSADSQSRARAQDVPPEGSDDVKAWLIARDPVWEEVFGNTAAGSGERREYQIIAGCEALPRFPTILGSTVTRRRAFSLDVRALIADQWLQDAEAVPEMETTAIGTPTDVVIEYVVRTRRCVFFVILWTTTTTTTRTITPARLDPY